MPVADPSIGIAVARELPNDGDRDDTLDFTLVRVGSWVRVVFADDSKSPAVLEAFTETPVTFFVANVGTEPLIDITARAQTPAALPGLTCDFAELGGPPTGTDWAGPLEVGDSFSCRGVVPGLAPGERHFLLLSFLGSGAESGDPIAEIGEIDWEGAVPDVTEPTTTTTAPPTPTIDVPAASPPPTAGSPGETLPETGLDGWAAVVGGLAALAGILLVLAGRATARDLR